MKLRDPEFWQPPKWISIVRNFLKDQSGVAVIEYVVISSIMGITLVLALPLLLRPLSLVFNLMNPGPSFE